MKAELLLAELNLGIFDIHRWIEIPRCLQCDTSNQSDVLKSYGLYDVSMYFYKTSNQIYPVNFIIWSLNHYQVLFSSFTFVLKSVYFPIFFCHTWALSVSFYRANERTYRLVKCMNHRYRWNRLKGKRLNKLLYLQSLSKEHW